jgi:hypothetical protein
MKGLLGLKGQQLNDDDAFWRVLGAFETDSLPTKSAQHQLGLLRYAFARLSERAVILWCWQHLWA